MIIKQVQVGAEKVFCYILACDKTGKAVIIDPGGEEDRLLSIIAEQQLELLYIINTHMHPDHTSGNAKLKKATGAQIVMHKDDQAFIADRDKADYFRRMGPLSPPADILVEHNNTLTFGECSLTIIHTPGHTPGSICLYGVGNLFTGDSLFVGAAGRVDLPGGDFQILTASLEERVATLPEETLVWPGHDYGDTVTSTVGREKKENPFLGGEW
jgi:glyoxylase-like metal-dependent hydrolase (beta-lactamase superfamily II)